MLAIDHNAYFMPDTGLAAPNLWDLVSDHECMTEQPLQVAQCTKIILLDPKKAELARAVNPAGAPQGQKGAHGEQDKYVINIKQITKFVVGLGDRVAPTDIEEGMRARYVVSDVFGPS